MDARSRARTMRGRLLAGILAGVAVGAVHALVSQARTVEPSAPTQRHVAVVSANGDVVAVMALPPEGATGVTVVVARESVGNPAGRLQEAHVQAR